MRGGARNNSGPAADPNALRRERDAGEWTILPASGRPGSTPEWPLKDALDRELELWETLWSKPQALMWERYGQDFEVALYVRRLVEAEALESKVTLSTLVRQMADSLGLTTPGLRNNRWRIQADESAQPTKKAPAARSSARDRFKVVRDDDEA